jgi:hypothetical protein
MNSAGPSYKQADSMEDLKRLLIDRLKRQGIEPDVLSLLLRDLTSILGSDSEIGTVALNAKLNVLGWPKPQLDYQSLQLDLAWVEMETAGSSTDQESLCTKTKGQPQINF